jgi:hypothetical protein
MRERDAETQAVVWISWLDRRVIVLDGSWEGVTGGQPRVPRENRDDRVGPVPPILGPITALDRS